LKGWESYAGWYWFATEKIQKQDSVIDGVTYKNDQIWFGLVQGSEEEWGDFSEAELKSNGVYRRKICHGAEEETNKFFGCYATGAIPAV
jgi:hypothetical protein